MASFTRPRPVAWFFFLLAFGTCMVLGTWQVQRLQWKENLIAEIAEANAQEPLKALPTNDALAAAQFRTVRVSGTWLPEQEFHLTPRYYRNQFGYGIVTPLKLADGRILLVNRGWVPGKKKLPETRPETAVKGKANFLGLIRTDADRNYFTPPNQPQKNIWFGRDAMEMADYAQLKNAAPAIVDIITPSAPLTHADAKVTDAEPAPKLPVPSDGQIRLRNDHLSYIITWYGIALGILVIFLVYHRKKV
ncbi:SURF1 family protein [Methylocystis sp.]|uniref:SURF1 family protein n=1 Tax=Methylocystis sp. TaxID=1911079 RepID=UPI003DA4F172